MNRTILYILYSLVVFIQGYIFIADRYEPGFQRIDVYWGFRFSPLVSQVVPKCSRTNDLAGKTIRDVKRVAKEGIDYEQLITSLGLPDCNESTANKTVWRNTDKGWKLEIEWDSTNKVKNVNFIKGT